MRTAKVKCFKCSFTKSFDGNFPLFLKVDLFGIKLNIILADIKAMAARLVIPKKLFVWGILHEQRLISIFCVIHVRKLLPLKSCQNF